MAARAGDLKTPTGRHDAAAGGSEVGLAAAIRALWTTYEATLRKEGVGAAAARRIGEDAVGFAMMEVLRTSLGFAGARDVAAHRRPGAPRAVPGRRRRRRA